MSPKINTRRRPKRARGVQFTDCSGPGCVNAVPLTRRAVDFDPWCSQDCYERSLERF
jgi:hypothetical protein